MNRIFLLVSLFLATVPPLGAIDAAMAAPEKKPLTRHDVLSIFNGKLHLDGYRFAEISFNKFDLFWALHTELLAGRKLDEQNPIVKAQENALTNLRKLGFRSIRIFAFPWGEHMAAQFQDRKSKQRILEGLDKTVELCERTGIGIVWSLGCACFVDEKEHLKELCANPQSANRKALYAYLREVVDRYKNSRAVLMWEISNEVTLGADIGENGIFDGKRVPNLKEVSGFYDDAAKIIKQLDPLRLVNNGGSNPREYQWNLYQKKGWKKDTYSEQLRCFDLLFGNSAVDVIDIHYYSNNRGGPWISGYNGREMELKLADYMELAAHLKKPLMIGELGCTLFPRESKEVWVETPNYLVDFSDPAVALPWVNKLLDDVVNAGVELSYWWAYQSDREMDQHPGRWDLSIERNPELIAAIAEANKRLKNKLGIHPSR